MGKRRREDTVTIKILVVPNLRTSHMKAVRYLKEEPTYDKLFLDFPENLEPLVKALAKGELSYRDFFGEVRERRLVPEPIEGWRYTAEPLLKSMPELRRRKPELELYCYKDVRDTKRFVEMATEIAQLTLRANVTRKINVEDWRNILREGLSYKREALNNEVCFIYERTSHNSTCTSGMDGGRLEQRLAERGYQVSLTTVEEWYHPTPLEILEERLAKGDILDEEVEELVKGHLEYVRNYILTRKNRDQAYYQWVYDKVPKLREKIDPKEIEYLDVLLSPNNI
jgi:hypothetical protein